MTELIATAAMVVIFLTFIGWQMRTFAKERETERDAFAVERKEWARERRDLNNRIQIPEAAPFLAEDDDENDDSNDLPVLRGFEMDDEALERAKRELEAVGYEEGPAA